MEYSGWSTRGQVQTGGVRLEVDTFGPPPGEAPTLVFLHEGLGSVSLWRDFPRALAGRLGLGGVSYSRLGYGGSEAAPLPRAVTYMHDEAPALSTLLAQLGVDRPILVGHSDGASIALLYAGSAQRPPPLALVLLAPHVFVEDLTVVSIARARAEQASIVPRLQKHHALPADEVFRGWADIWLSPAFRAWNIEAALPIVAAPTLVVQGVDDAYGTWAQVDAIRHEVRGPFAEERIEACGHSPHKDQPEATLEAITRFLGASLRGALPASSGPRPASPP